MKILVTGSSGHLGEALVRTLNNQGYETVGIDIIPSPSTILPGSITDRSFVKQAMKGVEIVLHTATLHKPHVSTHDRQIFIDTNITGTLNLLEEAVKANVRSFIYTSTTSTFGDALVPLRDGPATWIDEEVQPIPKNIYGVTKMAAEDLCELFFRNEKLPCIVLKTSRFFPEPDDLKIIAETYADGNVKANEYLYRRVEISDVVSAHLLAMEKAPSIGFNKYIISATTPFTKNDLSKLHMDAPDVVRYLFPDYESLYSQLNWKMFPVIDRVYVNTKARKDLSWNPIYDFRYILELLKVSGDIRSPLAKKIGIKGYHR
ncbi:MAG TPA: NAD(P)-dependent oxidoreductase [Puia sp.]|nr:NAD(P)-dependent oxidoreductase [Puia sp.]